MAINPPPSVPMGSDEPPDGPLDRHMGAALQHGHWRNRDHLASGLKRIERFLEESGFDRAPWLVVALAAGIAGWFVLPGPAAWLSLILCGAAMAMTATWLRRITCDFPFLCQSLAAIALMASAGCALAWSKSAMVGTAGIDRPVVATIEGRVLAREERPAEDRVRLLLAVREPGGTRAIRIRLNVAGADDVAGLGEGALVRVKARLIPPAPPMLPGGYDFARTAWFSGLAATGSALDRVVVVEPGSDQGLVPRCQRALSAHVRANLSGSPGAIAAAFASGDRGAIAVADEDAMRDAGLTHLLSISGLHVSAVIAAAYLIALRLLGLLPWLALRVRLPLVAASCGALAGIGYTLLTGAEVPTIRSCIGAVLVLLALVLGREPLSMRMVAVAAALVLVFWPEALVGPSFQMSFAAVVAIVALHGAAPIRALFAVREEPLWAKLLRQIGSLLLTGVVIELALMPIGLFHFHRAGLYGAVANVIAIPLTTVASMPLIALALLLDLAGAGEPFWWLAGKSLEALLGLAHWTAAMPGAVTAMPAMGEGAFSLFLIGGFWLALWTGPVRLWGLVPAALGVVMLGLLRPPDILISGDGHHVGITGEAGENLLVLRDSRSGFARENLTELAGMNGETVTLDGWPGASCNADFCTVVLDRGGRHWPVLLARGKDLIAERELAAACERTAIVISERRLPASCRPRWLKIDRTLLRHTGGLSIDLDAGKVRTVARQQGQHGWWQYAPERQALGVRSTVHPN